MDEQIGELTRQSDELLRRIASTGYEELKSQLKSLNELLEQLGKSEARWQQTATALKRWEEEDITSNQTLWDMEEFENRTIDLETLERLKKTWYPCVQIRKNSIRKLLPVSESSKSRKSRQEMNWKNFVLAAKPIPNTWKMPGATSSAAFWRKLVRAWMCMCWPICWT